MATTTLSHSESRKRYSWWWNSHNLPKNSKWLQENITDMDGKVKSMIKLIEEDADSFARRAEMYYKKRPELMKLVEEFYRAYRALAERYNHATGELRYAHRTIAAAFPDQVPYELIEDSSSKDGDPDSPDINRQVDALLNADDLFESGPHKKDSESCIRKRGLKQLQEMFEGNSETVSQGSKSGDGRVRRGNKDQEKGAQDEVLQLSTENQSLKDKVLSEIERAGNAEREVNGLKKALADMEAEKEDVLNKYQLCLEKLSKIEGELNDAQADSMRLDEKATQAEIEVHTLKEALVQLEVEKIAGMIKHRDCLEKISHLEAMASRFAEDMKALDDRAFEAESQAQTLKDEKSRLELETEDAVSWYKHCLEKISELENIISNSEDEARKLKEQAERAEDEISDLKKATADLNMEKEASALQYKYCLETISELEKDLANAKDDVQRLNNEVLIGTTKLRTSEDKCCELETCNQALRVEADDLAKKIAVKDAELSNKQEELEKLQSCLQDENMRHAQVEAALQTLQNLHSQSQDDQRILALELKNMLQMLKETEVSKHGLEEEIQQVRDENHSLSQAAFSSAVSMENMQNENVSLKEIRERLEKTVSHHVGINISLQHEILCLKKEIEGLNRSYEALVEQVEAAGLNPKCVGTSIKSMHNENSRLKQICEQESNEKEILLKKLENIEEALKRKVVVESSLSDLNGELKMSHEKVKALQESCQFINGEKATLVAEKACLLSQIQAMTENMNNLVRQNGALENSLTTAKIELEGLREKSKGLEGIRDLLKNERSYLLSERDTLVLKLDNVETRLEKLEKKFMGLEEKYTDLEKENEAMQCQVEELKVSLDDEQQERVGFKLLNEARMVGLENQIHLLQEESRWKKKESEEELDKAVKAQFEISILQKFMKDMEEKNCFLILECQKHVEASKLAEKVISELESESLEQQVEAELLLHEIERLRLGIYQIFRALETGSYYASEDKVEDERALVHHVLESVENMKSSISKHEDEKQKLSVENSVLLALIEQLESKGMEVEFQKVHLEKESEYMAEKLSTVNIEKDKLIEMNWQLKLDVDEGHQGAAILQAEFGSLCVKQADLQKAYVALQEAFSQVNQENTNLLKKLSELIEEKDETDQRNDVVLMELIATANQSEVLKSFAMEKVAELKSLLDDLIRQHEVNAILGKEMNELVKKLDLQKAENLVLKDAVCSLEREMQEIRECNVRLKHDMVNGKESLVQTEAKLLDTETKLKSAENLNSSLHKTLEELKIDAQKSLHIRENLEKNMLLLSESNSVQKNEIESLQRANKNLESELGFLRQEIEENIAREQTLSTELQGRNNEFELWEAEATSFCFDLQVSSINEVLLKNKVQELTGVCHSLEHKHVAKTSEIERMAGKISSMENEISRLKSQLSAYGPVIASVRDDITLIEHNAVLHTKLKLAQSQETEFVEVDDYHDRDAAEILPEDQSLLSLQNLQMRVKAVGKMMEETVRPVLQKRSSFKHDRNRKKGSVNELNDSPKFQKTKTRAFEVRNGQLMKDIPLDQASDSSMRKKGNVHSDDLMLELWETIEVGNEDRFENVKGKSETPSTDSDMEKELRVDKLELSTTIIDPNQEVSDVKILERLACDAEKLESLQITVEHLRQKLETNKKSRKAKNVNFGTFKEQLQETEDTIVHLVDLNCQLVKNIEECPPDELSSPKLRQTVKTWRIKVMEQAEKGSERIERLQLSVQKMHYMMFKLEDESKNKGSNKFLKSKTVILRDFIDNGRKNSGRRKKGPHCGCFRKSTSGNRGSL